MWNFWKMKYLGGSIFFVLGIFNCGTAFAESQNSSADLFQNQCVEVVTREIQQRDALPVVDDYGKVRRSLVDRAAEQAVEQVVGLEVASSREIKTALHNEVADSRYREEVTGESGGLVRLKVKKEEVVNQGDIRFLSLVFDISVCIPKTPKIPPTQISGVPDAFFDPITGQPKVWYWQSKQGSFEFFDNEGFHPRSGDVLQPITRAVVAEWQAQQEKREAAEQENIRKIEEEKASVKRQEEQADRCDDLAANPEDVQLPHNVIGVPYSALKLHADEAVTACRGAVAKSPSEGRYYYQLGRALQANKANKKEVIKYLDKAVELNHIAAYDNLGHITNNRNFFERGATAGDPSSMVSLAWMLEPKVAKVDTYLMQIQRPLGLYQKAGQLGHAGAKQRYEELKQEIEYFKVEAANKQLQNEQGVQIMQQFMGGILSKIGN